MSDSNENWTEYKSASCVPDVKKRDHSLGCVYIIEFGDNIKIGMSTDVSTRVNQLEKQARNYSLTTTGRVLVSTRCSNFRQIERLLHEKFTKFRIHSGELFAVSFNYAKDVVFKFNLEFKTPNLEEKLAVNSKMVDFVTEFKKMHDYKQIIERKVALADFYIDKKVKYLQIEEIGLNVVRYCEARSIELNDDLYIELEELTEHLYTKVKGRPPMEIEGVPTYYGEDIFYIEVAFEELTKFNVDLVKLLVAEAENRKLKDKECVTVERYLESKGVKVSESKLAEINNKLRELHWKLEEEKIQELNGIPVVLLEDEERMKYLKYAIQLSLNI